jgi:hypothetical protein
MKLTTLVLASMAFHGLWGATPFAATVVNSTAKARPDGSRDVAVVTGRYFRDALGRTRLEQGNSVSIDDPFSGTHIVLDTAAKTAAISTLRGPASAPANPLPPAATVPGAPARASAPKPPYTPPRALGSQVVEGLDAKGFQAEIVIPPGAPGGTAIPKRVVSQMWQAETLGVPILIRTTESFITPTGDRFSRETSTQHKDFVVNAAVAVDLFSVPDGYQVKNKR